MLPATTDQNENDRETKKCVALNFIISYMFFLYLYKFNVIHGRQ